MIAIIKSLDEEYDELSKAAAIHPGAGRGAPGMPRKKRGLVEGKDFVWHEGRKMKVIPNTKEEHMKHSNKKNPVVSVGVKTFRIKPGSGDVQHGEWRPHFGSR